MIATAFVLGMVVSGVLTVLILASLAHNPRLWLGDVPKEMQVPVLIYSLAIMTMLLACLNLNGKIPSNIFKILFAGAFLFMISDTFIALNKFKSADFNIPLARIWIMSLYLLGQYLMVRASARINAAIN